MKHSLKNTQRWKDYHEEKPPVLGPESVGIVPTNACNLNCLTCWSYSPLLKTVPSKTWKTQQLAIDIFLALLDDLAALQTQRIILTGGGDPLVYPHFEQVVAHAKSLQRKVTLISNLTLIKNLDRFLKLGIDTVQANFSASDLESYLAFHPNRKAADYKKMMHYLKEIALVSELKLVCVICKTNFRKMEEMLQVAAELNATIQFKLMSVTADTRIIAIDENERDFLVLQRNHLLSLAQRLCVKSNLTTFFQTLNGKDSQHFPIEEINCYAGYWYARIWADGSLHYCCNPHVSLAIGSLYEKPFKEWWTSTNYQALRQKLRDKTFVEGCERCGKFDLNYQLYQAEKALFSET